MIHPEQQCELLWTCPRSARHEQLIVGAVSGAGAGICRGCRWGAALAPPANKGVAALSPQPLQTLPRIHFPAVVNGTLKTSFSFRSKSWVIGTPWGNRLLSFCIREIQSVLRAVFRAESLSNEWDVTWVPRAQEKAEGGFLHLSEALTLPRLLHTSV